MYVTIKAAEMLGNFGHPWTVRLTCVNPSKGNDKFYEISGGRWDQAVLVKHGRNGTEGRTLDTRPDRCLHWGLDQLRVKMHKRGYEYISDTKRHDAPEVVDILHPPAKPKLKLTGPYARIKFLRREPNASIWEALDAQGQLLLHLPLDSAKQLLDSLTGWSGGQDLNNREIIKLS